MQAFKRFVSYSGLRHSALRFGTSFSVATSFCLAKFYLQRIECTALQWARRRRSDERGRKRVTLLQAENEAPNLRALCLSPKLDTMRERTAKLKKKQLRKSLQGDNWHHGFCPVSLELSLLGVVRKVRIHRVLRSNSSASIII